MRVIAGQARNYRNCPLGGVRDAWGSPRSRWFWRGRLNAPEPLARRVARTHRRPPNRYRNVNVICCSALTHQHTNRTTHPAKRKNHPQTHSCDNCGLVPQLLACIVYVSAVHFTIHQKALFWLRTSLVEVNLCQQKSNNAEGLIS